MISAVVESLAKTDIWSVGGNAQVDQDSLFDLDKYTDRHKRRSI